MLVGALDLDGLFSLVVKRQVRALDHLGRHRLERHRLPCARPLGSADRLGEGHADSANGDDRRGPSTLDLVDPHVAAHQLAVAEGGQDRRAQLRALAGQPFRTPAAVRVEEFDLQVIHLAVAVVRVVEGQQVAHGVDQVRVGLGVVVSLRDGAALVDQLDLGATHWILLLRSCWRAAVPNSQF